MYCTDVVLVRGKVGTVIGFTENSFTAAMCDGTTQVFSRSEITGVVSDALSTVKSFEDAICRQAQ